MRFGWRFFQFRRVPFRWRVSDPRWRIRGGQTLLNEWPNSYCRLNPAAFACQATKETNVPQYSVETIEAMQKHLLGYRDNLRVEVEFGIPIVARTVAELRTLSTWPGPLVLDVHIDLDPRLSVMTVRGAP